MGSGLSDRLARNEDTMAIRSEIDAWKEKKDSQRASGKVNEMLWYGLGVDEEYD